MTIESTLREVIWQERDRRPPTRRVRSYDWLEEKTISLPRVTGAENNRREESRRPLRSFVAGHGERGETLRGASSPPALACCHLWYATRYPAPSPIMTKDSFSEHAIPQRRLTRYVTVDTRARIRIRRYFVCAIYHFEYGHFG